MRFRPRSILGRRINFPEEKIYMRDLKQLVDAVPSYAQVKEEVLAALSHLLR